MKWHVALLISRPNLDSRELGVAWDTLTNWAGDKSNSGIVRVNSIQGLYEMMIQARSLANDLSVMLSEWDKEINYQKHFAGIFELVNSVCNFVPVL